MRISANCPFARNGPYPALSGDILLAAQTRAPSGHANHQPDRLPRLYTFILKVPLVTLASPQWTMGAAAGDHPQLRLGGHGPVKAAAFYEYGPAEAMRY